MGREAHEADSHRIALATVPSAAGGCCGWHESTTCLVQLSSVDENGSDRLVPVLLVVPVDGGLRISGPLHDPPLAFEWRGLAHQLHASTAHTPFALARTAPDSNLLGLDRRRTVPRRNVHAADADKEERKRHQL